MDPPEIARGFRRTELNDIDVCGHVQHVAERPIVVNVTEKAPGNDASIACAPEVSSEVSDVLPQQPEIRIVYPPRIDFAHVLCVNLRIPRSRLDQRSNGCRFCGAILTHDHEKIRIGHRCSLPSDVPSGPGCRLCSSSVYPARSGPVSTWGRRKIGVTRGSFVSRTTTGNWPARRYLPFGCVSNMGKCRHSH